MVMGPNAFTNHLAFLQSTISTLLDTAEYLKTCVTLLTPFMEGGGSCAEQLGLELPETQEQLTKT
jgi:hypothetical protein